MRRVASILLFILGGWILTSGIVVMWMDFTEAPEGGMKLLMIAIFVLFSLPFLLLGAWASPGKRWAELGLTLMITTGVGAAMALMTLTLFMDPSFTKLMPPDQPMPDIKFSPTAGATVSLLIGAAGWLLYRKPSRR